MQLSREHRWMLLTYYILDVKLLPKFHVALLGILLTVVEKRRGASVFVQRAFDVPVAPLICRFLGREVDVGELEDDLPTARKSLRRFNGSTSGS